MKKNTLIICSIAALSLGALSSSPVNAQAVAQATTFNVTINKVELCTSSACSSPIVLGSGAAQFDIASAAIGASIGNYASLDNVPKGTTVTHVRVTMSRTIGIAGTTPNPGNIVGTTCGTDIGDTTSSITAAGDGLIDGGGTVQTLVIPNEGAIMGLPAVNTYTNAGIILLPNGTEMTFLRALPTPFTMGDTPPIIDVSFETATGLQSFDDNGITAGGNCLMLPGVPVVSISVTD